MLVARIFKQRRDKYPQEFYGTLSIEYYVQRAELFMRNFWLLQLTSTSNTYTVNLVIRERLSELVLEQKPILVGLLLT